MKSIALAVLLATAALTVTEDAATATFDVIDSSSPATYSPVQALQVGEFRFDPLLGTPDVSSSLRYDSAASGKVTYYIVQFKGPITEQMKERLSMSGAKILYYVSSNAFVVRADGPTMDRVDALMSVRWSGIFEPAYKLSSRLSSREDVSPPQALGPSADTRIVSDSSNLGTGSDRVVPEAADFPGSQTGASSQLDVDVGGPSRIHMVVLPFESADLPQLVSAIARLGGSDILWSDMASGVIRAELDRAALVNLAREPAVMWIDREDQTFVFNDIARWVIQSGNTATFATPVHDHGVFGTGQVVTVGDTGIDYQHNAFEDPSHATPGPSHRKVTDYYIPSGATGDTSDNGINHGTHVSGTVAGDDGVWHVYNGDATGSNGTTGPHDGQAFDATLQVQDLSTDGYSINPPADLHAMYQAAASRGSSIHTNSWGSCCSDYIPEDAQTDDFIWNNPNFIVLYAAGNSGSGLYSLNPFAAAKNVIGVGASQNGAGLENVAYFSSRGPTRDGRLKPDIIAPGVGIWSAHGCDPGSQCDDYVQLSGTSMATPTAAGAATLVRQYYMDGWYPTGTKQAANGFTPSAALVKATLINGAAEMTGTGAYDNSETRYPNFNEGWGRILLDNALYFQTESRGLVTDDHRTGLNTGDVVTYQLAIGDTSLPVEITLVWSDYPSVAYTSPNLVNDLDLIVTAPDGTVYLGNQFTGYNPGQSQRNPTSADRLNNVEAVLVRTGVQTGLWTVRVSGYNVPMGPQPFAIVMTGGIAREKGVVQMDRNSYRSSATVKAQVVDAGLNVNPNARDTATVDMTSTTETTPETITLTETGLATATFSGSIQLQNSATASHDGILQVRAGNTITARYFDANDGMGGSGPVTDTAIVDDTPPAISSVAAVSIRFFRATIVWTTDENADSLLTWGASSPPSATKSDAFRATSHSFVLAGLAEQTTYYFSVQSTDEAGNVALDNNGGSYYRFTTPAKPADAPSSPEWPQFHHGRERGGVSPVPFSLPLTPRWNTTLGGSRIRWSGAVIDNHTVFYTEREGTLTALDLGTGAVRWQAFLGDFGYVHGTPTVTGGTVYVAMVTGSGSAVTLFAVNETTGTVRWKVPATASAASAFTTPTVDANNVYWYDYSGKKLHASDAKTGAEVWTYTMPDKGFQGPTYWAGIVFVTDGVGNIVAVDSLTGVEFWRLNAGAMITSAPTLAGGVLYVADYAGSVHAINPLTGVRIWTASQIGKLIDVSSPVVVNRRVYVGAFATEYNAGRVYALNAANGSVVWSYLIPSGPVGASAAYDNGTLFVAAWDGSLYAWNAGTGALLKKLSLSPAGSSSSVALGDGYLVVGDDSGKLSAFSFVGAGDVRRVQATPASADVPVATSALFRAQAYDAYDNLLGGRPFAWSSTNALGTVLTTSDSGDRAVYTAGTTAGTDLLQASSSGVSTGITIHVLAGSMDRVAVSPSPASVTAGTSQQFAASGTDRYGNPVSESSFAWSVDGGIGTIDASGRFTASTTVGIGTVTATSGASSGMAVVEIVPGPLASLAVSPASATLSVSEPLVLAAVAQDTYDNAIDDVTITWSATAGTVTPMNALGTAALYVAPQGAADAATITATAGAVSKTVTVTVVGAPAASLRILPVNPSVPAGGSLVLSIAAADVYGNPVNVATISWSTSAGSIAADGTLAAPTEAGAVAVIASASGLQAQTTVMVLAGELEAIEVTPASLPMTTGSGANLAAVARDAYGNEIGNATFAWSTTIGSLRASADGRNAVFLAGDQVGSGTITVRSGDKTTSIDVSVAAGGVGPPAGSLEGLLTAYVFPIATILLAAVCVLLALRNRRLKRKLRRATHRPEPVTYTRPAPGLRTARDEDDL